MLAYIWREKGVLPGVIYNLPALEKEFIYQATIAEINARKKADRQR